MNYYVNGRIQQQYPQEPCGDEQLGCRCDLPQHHEGLHEGKDAPMRRRMSWRTNEVDLWAKEKIQRILEQSGGK